MQHRTLGKTNLNVSVIGFGAAPAAYLKTERDRAVQVIGNLLDSGVNLIDTAASYPGSEEFLGDHFASRREEFVLVSKCGNQIPESDAAAWSAELIAATLDRSLRLLKTDRLDVMLLHSCDLATLRKGEALGSLVKARDAGKIRFVGYSGDNEAAAYAATIPDVAVIETSISIADQMNIDSVLPKAREHNVGVIAKRPIANAAWKDISQQAGIYQGYAKKYTDRLKQMNITPQSVGFTGVGTEDATAAWPEMALRFTLSFEEVACAIIGTTNPANAIANIATVGRRPLTKEVIRNIRDAYRKADPAGKWTGQT